MYQPNFTINNTILSHIGKIEAAREVIINAPLVPAWEKKFREEAIIRTVHHGTRIEGNELNISEAARILQVKADKAQQAAQEAGVVGRDRDVQEIINYRNVVNFLEEYQKFQRDLKEESSSASIKASKSSFDMTQGKPLGKTQGERESRKEKISDAAEKIGIHEEVIKHLHKLTVEKIMEPESTGEYRQTQVVVKNTLTGEVTFRPPPAVEVPFLMKEFIDWLNKTKSDQIHPVLKAGIAQYELVRIHPFLDGNGRVARALAMLILFLEDYDIRRFFSLEEYYDRDSKHYYQALQSVEKSRQMDLTPWLEYFSQGLAVELNRVKEKVRKLSTDMHLKDKLGGEQVFLSERQIKIVEYIQKAGFLQNKAFRQLFPMISEDTVLREVKGLIDKGIVKKEGVTKAAKYVLVK